MSLSSNVVHDDYIPLLLHGITGMLYNRFSDLWPPALDCLGVLISKHKELVWSQFIQFIAFHQSKGLTVRSQEKLEAATHPQCMSQTCAKCSVCAILLQTRPYAPLPLFSFTACCILSYSYVLSISCTGVFLMLLRCRGQIARSKFVLLDLTVDKYIYLLRLSIALTLQLSVQLTFELSLCFS